MNGLTTVAPLGARAPLASEGKEPEREIRFLGDLQRVHPQPGDVFLLTVPGPIDQATAARLRDTLSNALNGAKVLVLGDGLKVECIGAGSGD